MIQRKTPLKRSTKPIARRTPLKPSTKPIKRSYIKNKPPVKKVDKPSLKPAKLKTIPKLKAEADMWFSRYIRFRDGRYTHERGWETECITCSRWLPYVQMQAGHFVTRGVNDLRFDEENVNGQCLKCNVFGSGEQYKYSVALDIKYGEGTAVALMSRRNIMHKFLRHELEQIVHDAKICIEHYKQQETANMVNKPKKDVKDSSKKDIKKPLNTAITNPDEPANKKYKRRKINIVQK
jgi:hypothetical protein